MKVNRLLLSMTHTVHKQVWKVLYLIYFSYYAKQGNAQAKYIYHPWLKKIEWNTYYFMLFTNEVFFFPSQNNETYVFSIIFTTHAILACPSEAKQQKNLASWWEIWNLRIFIVCWKVKWSWEKSVISFWNHLIDSGKM